MSSFNYIAILGRQPELGLVELESLLGAEALEPFGRYAVRLSALPTMAQLGGVQKLAEVLYDGPAVDLRDVPVDVEALPMSESKTPFALSVYGMQATTHYVLTLGLELKKRLRARGSVRLVTPTKGLVVTAAQLKHNNVLERGFELLVVVSKQRMVVARTVAVQDIDWYSRRDYDRPARSAKVGMLPPKLAQVLVNTTAAGTPVVDPFCGTGVVLQEAMLMGRPATGSDVAPEMVAATRENLTWLAQEVPTPLPAWSAAEVDARTVVLPAGAAVVSEGYLGPNQSQEPTAEMVAEMRQDLLALYLETLRNWSAQLVAGADVALCVPAWRVRGRWEYLGVVDELPRLGYTLKSFQHVRTPLLYAREDQIVGRQLLLLRKI